MTDKTAKPERVIFRVWRETGDVIAIFPDQKCNLDRLMCYEHIGQHGEGNYPALLDRTRLARDWEYAALLKELETIGYVLRIVKRV